MIGVQRETLYKNRKAFLFYNIMEEGYLKGEFCNRDNCKGIIQEHDSDSCCSCHINPPCSYCETSREYCPECDWDGHEEQQEENRKSHKKFISSGQSEIYQKQREESERIHKEFEHLYRSKELVDKLDYRSQSHTHFSMIKYGVFPISMSTSELRKEIDGSFGGRFQSLNTETGRFKFIAYTD